MFINLELYKLFLFTFSKLQALCFYLMYFLRNKMLNKGTPISHKNTKGNYPGLALAIDPPTPRRNFVHYNFLILHYISHKMKYVSPLRVAALKCNIMLRMFPAK